MTKPAQQTVVIADYDYGDVDIERAIIEGAGLRLVAADCKTEDDVIAAARDADAVIAQYATVGPKAIDAFTRCKVVARYGTGVDIVDVAAATRRGIVVTNVPNDWCQNEVADHAMALLLAAARKICGYDRATRAGTWRWQSGEPIHRLQGRTLGLLAFGAIAQAVAARAHAGRLRVYRGNHDRGMAQLAHGQQFAPDELLHFPHRLGHGTLAQLMRVLHSTEPMSRGTRVCLNLNLRSRNHPYVDDNPLYYLAADNPSFDWVDQYIEDVRTRQLPAYLEAQA